MKLIPDDKALEGDLYEYTDIVSKGVYHTRRRAVWFPPVPSLAIQYGDQDTKRWGHSILEKQMWLSDFTSSTRIMPHPRWADLYHFQREGVRFILGTAKVRDVGIRALLGDDPRLGKTIQALMAADLSTLNIPKPTFLIICLGSLKQFWADVIETEGWFQRTMPVTILDGTKQQRLAQINSFTYGFLIVHWEALRQFPELAAMDWDWIIGDEAHKAKNHQTKVSKALRKLKAKHKLFLSATFAEKGPTEYWSLLHSLMPKQYSSYHIFKDWFAVYMDVQGFPQYLGPKNQPLFRELLRDVLLRRRSKDVDVQLPPVTEKPIRVPLPDGQQHWYNKIVKEIVVELANGEELEIPNAAARVVRLRQASLTSQYFDETRAEAGKIDALAEMVKEEFGHSRFIVYCSFRLGVDLVLERLRRDHISIVKAYGGDIKGIRAWQTNPEIQGLVATPQVGGVGLNLAEADYLVYLDMPWSSILFKQSRERLSMPGKTRPIQLVYLVGINTIDETVLKALRRKEASLNQLDLNRLILRSLKLQHLRS